MRNGKFERHRFAGLRRGNATHAGERQLHGGLGLAAAHAAEQPQVVAEVDDACHHGVEHVGALRIGLAVQHHALGADAGLDGRAR
jgi:hypothetical protein